MSKAVLCACAILFCSCRNKLTEPCDSEIRSNVLEVRRIYDSGSKQAVPTAVFSEFIVDGRAFSDGAARTGVGLGANLISVGSMTCGPPCKLGYEEHKYSFVVTAPAYASKRVEFQAQFVHVTGSCPTVYEGETVVEIELDRS
jgi:hypothetical protein